MRSRNRPRSVYVYLFVSAHMYLLLHADLTLTNTCRNVNMRGTRDAQEIQLFTKRDFLPYHLYSDVRFHYNSLFRTRYLIEVISSGSKCDTIRKFLETLSRSSY